MSVIKILAKNKELYNPTPIVNLDQSRLVVSLDQNIIDDINQQIESKQQILENDPLFATVNTFFVNVIDVFYGFMQWIAHPLQTNLLTIIFTGYRPFSLVIFIVLIAFISKFIWRISTKLEETFNFFK